MSFNIVAVLPEGRYREGWLETAVPAGIELTVDIGDRNEEELISVCRHADYLVTIIPHYKYSAGVLRQMPKCRFIQTVSIGYDGIDVGAATEQGIGIINLGGFCAEELAEHAMSLMMACARWITVLQKRLKAGNPVPMAGAEAVRNMHILKGKTLGLIGFGNSGRALASIIRGLDMRVLAYDPHVDESVFQRFSTEKVGLEELLRGSDFVSVHANLTTGNRHMIGLEQLKMMKRTASIVNIARGALIDEQGLYTALKEGYIAGAGLDVTEIEPVPVNSPLWELDNVILTGHNAGSSPESSAAMFDKPVEELLRVLNNKWPVSLINPEVKERYVAKWGDMSD